MILRCTKKLLAIIGPALVGEPAPPPDAEDWYANLLRFDRRKCLLLTHSATLFTIFEADVNAAGLRATRHLVTRLIGRELRSESLPPGTFGDLGSEDVVPPCPAEVAGATAPPWPSTHAAAAVTAPMAHNDRRTAGLMAPP